MKGCYAFLARAIVALHFGIVLVVITPAICLCIQRTPPRWVVEAALAATIFTIVSFLYKRECLLNSLERFLCKKAGQTNIYQGPFVEHYAKQIGIQIPKRIVSTTILLATAASIFYLWKM